MEIQRGRRLLSFLHSKNIEMYLNYMCPLRTIFILWLEASHCLPQPDVEYCWDGFEKAGMAPGILSALSQLLSALNGVMLEEKYSAEVEKCSTSWETDHKSQGKRKINTFRKYIFSLSLLTSNIHKTEFRIAACPMAIVKTMLTQDWGAFSQLLFFSFRKAVGESPGEPGHTRERPAEALGPQQGKSQQQLLLLPPVGLRVSLRAGV